MAHLKDLMVIGATHFIGDVNFSKIPKYNGTELALNNKIIISATNGLTTTNGTFNLNDEDIEVSITHAAKPAEDKGTSTLGSDSGRTYITGFDIDDYGHIAKIYTNKEEDQSLSGYKPIQTAVQDPTAGSDATLEFIATISQGTDGVISATKQKVDLSNYVTTDSFVNAMEFKGTLGTDGTTPNLSSLTGASAAEKGNTYKVITAGTYKYDDDKKSVSVKVGDTIIYDGSTWVVIPSGDVDGVTNIATIADGGLQLQDNEGNTVTSLTSIGKIGIADEGVLTAHIADEAITNDKIADKTITNGKIADTTIELGKLNTSVYSTSGYRSRDTLVATSDAGKINSAIYALTTANTAATEKATIQYDTDYSAIKFIIN